MLHRTLRLIPHPALPSLIRMTSTWTPLLHPYPPAPRHPITETFTTPRGPITLPDPYQWLHDPLSPLTTKFVEEQSEYAKRYLEGYRDRDKFGNELRRNWNYPRFSTPSLKEDGNYYYTVRWSLLVFLSVKSQLKVHPSSTKDSKANPPSTVSKKLLTPKVVYKRMVNPLFQRVTKVVVNYSSTSVLLLPPHLSLRALC